MKTRTGSVSDMPQDLAALRGLLDTRLAALEKALADPNQHGSLEQIILDLARVATEEAVASARQAYLEAQREGQGALAAARAEARSALESERAAGALVRSELDEVQAAAQQERADAASVRAEFTQAHTELQQERTAAGSMRAELDQARAALQQERAAVAAMRAELDRAQAAFQQERAAAGSVRAELDQAKAAVQQERTAAASVRAELDKTQAAVQQERGAAGSVRAELDQAQAALQKERAAAATRERDLAALRKTIEQEEAGRSSLERKIVDANAAVETERAAAAGLQQQLAQLESAHRSERDAGMARERDLAAVQQALEQELKQEQAAHANLRREFEDARAAAVSVQQALERAQTALQSERAGAGRDQDLAAARDALETELKREQTAHANLNREFEDVRAAAGALQQALEQAQAALQSERAGANRDQGLAAAKDTLEAELKRERMAHAILREQFETTRGAPEGDRGKKQTDLERAAKDAQARAEAATLALQKVLTELDAAKQASFVSEADAKVKYEKLRDAADHQIRSLQLKVSDADQRAAAAESDLDLLRRDPTVREASAGTASFSPPRPAAPPVAGQASPAGPVRAAKRTAVSGEVDIQIDGNPSKLIDLSMTGAQILSPGALKPNRLITLTLPLGEGRVSCKGKIMWARLEPGRKGGLWYRAGIMFTSADEGGIEQFLNHQSRGKE